MCPRHGDQGDCRQRVNVTVFEKGEGGISPSRRSSPQVPFSSFASLTRLQNLSTPNRSTLARNWSWSARDPASCESSLRTSWTANQIRRQSFISALSGFGFMDSKIHRSVLNLSARSVFVGSWHYSRQLRKGMSRGIAWSLPS
jgi:hypothetical protein